ncbi:maltokinase N-terminal cap-like domain-containing protein [Cryptosporangium japonicum]|uniref:Maltokinase N-terminal cap domain-containing protein n=1 Tax=Cryptosporangium japonicum TaxID=80872 RepID=A0ABN0V867_9ACTN
MATVHDTTLVPTKLELLTAWLPRRPWYRGSGVPRLTKAGGFRLDDPAGEVGIEIMVVLDAASPDVDAYLVPMTYRAAPTEGELIGTMEHGVLGTRFAYDGDGDPVLRAALIALVRGDVQPQAQSRSDTVDPTVRVGLRPPVSDVTIHRVLTTSDAPPQPGEVSVPWRTADGGEARGVVASGR